MRRCATRRSTRPTPTPLLLVGLLIATHPTDAASQRRQAAALDAGDHVEVRLLRGEVLTGRFIRFDRDGLVLEARNRERFLAAEDIDRVWWYDDRSRDFTIGGAIGGGLTMGVTLALLSPGGWSDFGGRAVGGVAGGLLVGALAGKVAGSIASDWEEVGVALRSGGADIPLGLAMTVAPTVRQAGTAASLGLRISLPAPR